MKKLTSILSLLLMLSLLLSSCHFGALLGDGGGSKSESLSESESAGTSIETEAPEFTGALQGIPWYTDSPFAVVNNNIPDFKNSDYTTTSYEHYSDLDSLGRCGVTMACVGRDIMPTEDRGSIGSVKPSGWHTVKYDVVDGKYLYNRCHLIGYQLTGENANRENLITGTRYMNVVGMLPFEDMVADYVKETGNHVLLRVTPVFLGNNLVAHGVQMEAYSVEDGGEEICFNVFVYNVQPGIVINYKTGESALATDAPTWDNGEESSESSSESESESEAPVSTYVLNTNTKRYHKPTCSSLASMKEENKKTVETTEEELLDMEYSPCGICKPHQSESEENTEKNLLSVKDIDTPVSIVHQDVKAFYDAIRAGETTYTWDYTKEHVDGNLTFTEAGRKAAERVLQSKKLHMGVPVTLSYLSNEVMTSAVFLVDTDEDFENAVRQVAGKDGTASFYNLLPNTTYYYKVLARDANDTLIESNIATFTTEDAPRFLYVENLINARDIGGYTGLDGKRIKYGMVYRGSELDGKVEPTYKLNENGKEVMLDELLVSYDMDLRGTQSVAAALGDGVPRDFFTMRYYSEIFQDKNKAVMGQILKEFAKPENYPIYVHCTYGADRTGTVCFLLEALLGVDKADLLLEYTLTGFAFPHVSLDRTDATNPPRFLQFVEDFEALSGDTYAEKAETYCKSVGLTDREIAAIRSLLLENR